MPNMKELAPKGEYKVKTVGPSRDWEFTGSNGSTVKMATESIQFEGYEQFWVDVNRAQDKPVPAVGEVLRGHIEQDEAGKYPPKLQKEKSGGGNWQGGGGGGKASPGAIWAQNVETATVIVASFYQATGKKPKDFDSYLAKIQAVAPKVGAMVDGFVAKATPAASTQPASNSEAGETAAPAAAPAPATTAPDASVQDISDEDLGDW